MFSLVTKYWSVHTFFEHPTLYIVVQNVGNPIVQLQFDELLNENWTADFKEMLNHCFILIYIVGILNNVSCVYNAEMPYYSVHKRILCHKLYLKFMVSCPFHLNNEMVNNMLR